MTVAPGDVIRLSSRGVPHCEDGGGSEMGYSVVIADGAGHEVSRELDVKSDGSFDEKVMVPDELVPGSLTITVVSDHSEFCRSESPCVVDSAEAVLAGS
jgi:hypothetical protein